MCRCPRTTVRACLTAATTLLVASTLTGISTVGCSARSTPPVATLRSATTSPSSPPNSAPADPTDYTRLLIQATDIQAPEAFTASPAKLSPNPPVEVETTFRNPDGSHVIYDLIEIAADPGAAMRALEQRKAIAQTGTVHGLPDPVDIGTGGTLLVGPSPDGSKSIADLMFTEGRAFAEIEFDGPPDAVVPPDFVTGVGQKQDQAIKNGLPR